MNELSKNLRCVLVRSGIEIWIEESQLNPVMNAVENQKARFIEIKGELVNISDIVGVFTPNSMEDRTRRKNGQWRCKKNQWHEKGKQCDCSKKRFDKDGKVVEIFITGQGWVEA